MRLDCPHQIFHRQLHRFFPNHLRFRTCRQAVQAVNSIVAETDGAVAQVFPSRKYHSSDKQDTFRIVLQIDLAWVQRQPVSPCRPHTCVRNRSRRQGHYRYCVSFYYCFQLVACLPVFSNSSPNEAYLRSVMTFCSTHTRKSICNMR